MTGPSKMDFGFARTSDRAGLLIDGEAVVLARRPGAKSDAEKAAAAPIVHASAGPDEIVPAAPLSNRAHETRRRASRRLQPDLLVQAQSLSRFAAPGRSLRSTRAAGGLGTRIARIGAISALGLAALVPAAVLLAPERPSSGTEAAGAPGFVLAELQTGILPRGAGAVLSVTGVIRNMSAVGGTVPPLRIALADGAGTMQTRPVATGAQRLAAGGALRFHSAVAVPAGTRGDILVDFVPAAPGATASGKTSTE